MAQEFVLKIIVIGETGVGKTSLSKRFQLNKFQTGGCQETVVADIWKKDIHVMGKNIRLELFDTAGKEKYESLVLNYFRNVDGVLLVYDVTDILTFNKLSGWLQKVREHALESIALVVGNKTDHSNRRAVSRSIVRRFTQEEGLEFIETSAKSGVNVQQVFEYLAGKILLKKYLVLPDAPIVALSSESSSEKFSLYTEYRLNHAYDSLSVPQVHQADTLTNSESESLPDILLETCYSESTRQKLITVPSEPQYRTKEDFQTVNLNNDSSNDFDHHLPLDDDTLELQLNRRRKISSDSLLSFVTDLDEFKQAIELHREAQKAARKKSKCCVM